MKHAEFTTGQPVIMFEERLLRAWMLNRWGEYRRCNRAPICRSAAKAETIRAIHDLRAYHFARGNRRYRSPF